MSFIDTTAHIALGARIGERVSIGPFCVIGPEAIIGDDCRLIASVNIQGRTEIGPRTQVHPNAVLGGAPQAVAYKGEPTRLVIGSDCIIRECVTMNIGTAQGGGITTVGDRGMFMAYSHVAHDCRLGNDIVFANAATLAGHCLIGDNVVISGLVAVHQFSRIGIGAMVAGGSIVRGDVVPYGLAAGPLAQLIGINVVGMRRRGQPAASIRATRAAFRRIFLSGGSLEDRIEATAAELGSDPAVAQMIDFLRESRRRPLCQARANRRTDAQGDKD